MFKLPDVNKSFTLPLSSLGLGRPPHIKKLKKRHRTRLDIATLE